MTGATGPMVSVVIPVWDRYVRWLPESAGSALSQGGVAAEVVVVDNASSVDVPEIPGARVVRAERRLSTGAARNLGLLDARAPLVVFLDADDVLLPGALAALVAGIRAHPGAAAFTMAMIDGDTGRRHRAPRRISRVLATSPRAFAIATGVWSLLPTQGATIMPTATVRDAGGYADRSQGEDWALAAALAWRGRVRFDEQPAIVYRWRGDSPGQPGAPVTLLANARAVRERLRSDPGVPFAARHALGAIAVAQWLAVVAVRPVVRGTRSLRGRIRGLR
jgi:hypothetical protein